MSKYNAAFSQVAMLWFAIDLATAQTLWAAGIDAAVIVALIVANFAERWMADILCGTYRDLAEGFRELHKQAAKRADDWRDLYQWRKARETPNRVDLN